MMTRIWLLPLLAGVLLLLAHAPAFAPACCPAPRFGEAVVNADQTVIILWDPATKTEHFIRQASFKSEADDFGFLIPSPSRPELNESGNEAFPYLRKLTEPEIKKVKAPPQNVGCGCLPQSRAPQAAVGNAKMEEVRVLEEKLVAGFHASVLEADSTEVLVTWLKDHGYAYSPEVAAWAKPYVGGDWKITALKVAKSKEEKQDKTVAASALRMTFKTDRPLFPYREPDTRSAAKALEASQRLLRIYFLSDGRYQGDLTKETPWTGKVAWAGSLNAENRTKMLELLKLPEPTGPADWWLTEFEDPWPYQLAPADVYFARDADQSTVKRPPIIEYVSAAWPSDVTAIALVGVLFVPAIVRRVRRRRA
ncbi:MAG TPA: DUF2330 domain-containing protein [Gemmataceae bacterium]|jgi:hypothetical protein